MTHDTDPDDAAVRANRNPADASTADIEAALEERRLFSHWQRIDGCRRCQEKNQKRRHAGINTVDYTFDDGDDVILHAVHRDGSDITDEHWLVTAAEHREHPQLPFEDAISQGTDLVRARACVRERDDGRMHFVDVDIFERSRAGDGPSQSVVGRRQQSQIVDDGPDDMNVIEIDPDEAPAHWPDGDRQWLRKLANVFELERRTYSIEKTDIPGANPRGDWQR